MRPLLHFLRTSSVSTLVMSATTTCQFPSGMRPKEGSCKVLMGMILVIFGLQTVHNTGNWDITWLDFIHYGNIPALEALEGGAATSPSRYIVQAILELLTTFRLAIADSIMVSKISTERSQITISVELNIAPQ
jgi:hypothetical protein